MEDLDVAVQGTATLNSLKSVNKAFADIGDTLTYTIGINNSGDADAFNLVVTDLVPQGANFINNTVKINGVTQSGVNPALGINVGTIAIGSTSTIELMAIVVTLPWSGNLINTGQLDFQFIDTTTTPSTINSSIDTNSVTTTINTVIPSLVKTVDSSLLTGVGQVITYTLRISNSGNATATNLRIIDTIPTGTSFVSNSISIMGTSVAGTVEPPSGFDFGNLPPNSFTTLSFKVTVNTIPLDNKVSNQGRITYDYVVDPVIPTTKNGTLLSNIVITQGVAADLSGITKFVDKAFATINDILTYTITIPNSGNATAINVVVSDTIPIGTSYIENSLKINGVALTGNPLNINVGTIPMGTSVTVEYQVKVN